MCVCSMVLCVFWFWDCQKGCLHGLIFEASSECAVFKVFASKLCYAYGTI